MYMFLCLGVVKYILTRRGGSKCFNMNHSQRAGFSGFELPGNFVEKSRIHVLLCASVSQNIIPAVWRAFKASPQNIHWDMEGCGFDSARSTGQVQHSGRVPQSTSPHHRGTSSPHYKWDDELGTWPGLSELSGQKYPASHEMYFCGDAFTGMLL